MDEPPTARRSRRELLLALAAVTLVAVATRLWWVSAVQPPSAAVFSDMRSYIDRACIVAGYREIATHRAHTLALWPYGAHTWYAALLALLGPAECAIDRATGWAGGSLVWMDRAHAVTAATVAPLAFLTTREVARPGRTGLLAATAVGLAVALWPPLLTYVGFYSSEVPYSVCLAASLWAAARIDAEGRGAWFLGLTLAVAATVRPVALLTAILALPWLASRLWSKRARLLRAATGLLLPVILVLALSSWRFHDLTGRWGLISANGTMAQLFAVTDVKTIANHPTRGFHPPARGEGYEGHFGFTGRITDEAPVRAELERVRATLTVAEHHRYLHRNVRLLVTDNDLWPERNAVRYARDAKRPRPAAQRWRRDALPTYERLGWGLCVLAAAGAVRGVRAREAGTEFALLHVVALVYAAAFYFGEARYRVPYDVGLFVLAGSLAAPRGTATRRAWLVGAGAVVLGLWIALPL